MILSKKAGNFPDDRAHVISTMATAAAARITNAYSAVVCPSSRRQDRLPDTTSTIHVPAIRRTVAESARAPSRNSNISHLLLELGGVSASFGGSPAAPDPPSEAGRQEGSGTRAGRASSQGLVGRALPRGPAVRPSDPGQRCAG